MSAVSMLIRHIIRYLLPAAICATATVASNARAEPSASPGSSIVVAGQPVEVGRPVVLWSDPQGFDAYQERCIDQSGGCCDSASKRYGARKGVDERTLPALQKAI